MRELPFLDLTIESPGLPSGKTWVGRSKLPGQERAGMVLCGYSGMWVREDKIMTRAEGSL